MTRPVPNARGCAVIRKDKPLIRRELAHGNRMLYGLLFIVLAPLLHAQPLDAGPRLVFEVDDLTSALTVLRDDMHDLDWIDKTTALFELGPDSPLQARLRVERLSSTEIELTLTLHNPTDRQVTGDVGFPVLSGLGGEDVDADQLTYCFPRADLRLGTEPIELEAAYSSRFPLQFLSAHNGQGRGVYLLTCDTQMHRKQYRLSKDRHIAMGATYLGVQVGAGETLVLPKARVGLCDNGWHGAFDAYRRWVKTWYAPAVPRKDWFRRVFNFRQVFLYPNLDTTGLYDPAARRFNLEPAVTQDIERFGGVDYLHLFDWSQTPEQGRVGAYDPWGHFPRDAFVDSVERVQDRGIPVGLYFEGYLVSPRATIPGRPGRDWQLLNDQGGRYDPFGSGDDYLCPGVQPWRDHLTQAVRRAHQQTAANGYYIDQFGFSYQYPCYDPTHGHAVPSNQVRLESEMIQQIRKHLPAEQILYTEQTPVDVAMQFQDGSFSYTLLHSRHPGCPSRINLSRFAFPDFKQIQILRGDGPIGDDALGVKLVFFNGDGLWLVGPSDNPRWYSPSVLEAIQKTHRIKKAYADAFISDDVQPLVPTLIPGVYANRFAAEDKTVWTLYNSNADAVAGSVIEIEHVEGARYFDAWNQQDIAPKIDGTTATIFLNLPAHEVGCIVQLRGE